MAPTNAMHQTAKLLWIPILLLAAPFATAKPVEAGFCDSPVLAGGGYWGFDAPTSGPPPRVRGKSFEVPALRLRFQDHRTGRAVGPAEAAVCYDWRWFRYPYPETLLGAWEISYECRRCRLNEEGTLAVPAHEVVPRGWYNGWLLLGRRPRFEGVRVELEHAGRGESFPRLGPEPLRQLKTGGGGVTSLRAVDVEMTVSAAPLAGN